MARETLEDMKEKDQREKNEVYEDLAQLKGSGVMAKFDDVLKECSVFIDKEMWSVYEAKQYIELAKRFEKIDMTIDIPYEEKMKRLEVLLNCKGNKLSKRLVSAIEEKYRPTQAVDRSEVIESKLENEMTYGMSGKEVYEEFKADSPKL